MMSSETGTTNAPLNDVMIAMDVVDTLRHDTNLVERELNDEARRKDLIERLREIYRGQGIEVPDRILEEGVQALEQDRFVYKPPEPDNFRTRIARLYVSRMDWGRYVIGIVAGITALFLANHFFVERPKLAKIEAQAHELNVRLPASLNKLVADITSEARSADVADNATGIATSGLNAASSGDLKVAQTAEKNLRDTLAKLREDYEIRIVNRSGEVSGLWRIPQDNPDAYNFYLVVEAITKHGNRLPQTVTNEETGKTERVPTWAVRVNRSVLVAVQEDKNDDGIIQNAVVGRKNRGDLKPTWTITVTGGAITRWN